MNSLMPDGRGGYSCRAGCGACCIAPSIAAPLPGHPHGKAAGQTCSQLDDDMRCTIFGQPERPTCCVALRPHPEMCGRDRDEALRNLEWLEQATSSP